MGYTHIKYNDRVVIQKLLSLNYTQKAFAKVVNKHPSTICRELKKNKSIFFYYANEAQEKSKNRRKDGCKKKLFEKNELWNDVYEGLINKHSPEQIEGRQKLLYKNDKSKMVSKETIYSMIYYLESMGQNIAANLRYANKKRKRRRNQQENRLLQAKKRSIHKRPKVVNEKKRIGDWEGDTIEGQKGTGLIVTFVERKSTFLVAAKLPTKHSEILNLKTRDAFSEIENSQLKTITLDQGTEFSNFINLEENLNCKTYFADKASPWQRGLNENTNGLLRQFFPKKSSFENLTDEKIKKAVDLLNHRPRKSLGFRTPHEAFFGIKPIALQI
ncbi:MAG: IS30 family transposase [Spirochaetia bacterium]|nr:IS30 family transposase [Spirochaetia bacterium]